MNDVYALWTSGPRGPEFTLLWNRGKPPLLTERERALKLREPMLIQPGEHSLPISKLQFLYPLLPKDRPEAGPGLTSVPDFGTFTG